tara:strand:- start:384 stop:569 length:186 start_codon:yes stop_codon:yes gene_type:complete
MNVIKNTVMELKRAIGCLSVLAVGVILHTYQRATKLNINFIFIGLPLIQNFLRLSAIALKK